MIRFFYHKSGMILFTVIVMVLILSVVVISIISLNVSQFKSSQSVVDEIKAEYLAKGHFYRYHQQRATTAGTIALPSGTATLDGKTFTLNTVRNAGAGANATDQIVLTVSF